MGYLKQLLPRRPDLKVIITSATIDAERFSQHFNGAPVLEVSGRTYPVEILYRPLTSKDEDDAEVELTDAIVDAADELAHYGEGDILVFLPGEREIREAAEALRKSTLRRNDEILLLSHACRTPNSTKSSTPQAQNAASCWQPTSPKPRSPCRASNTSSTPASHASNAIPHGRKWSSFMSKKSPKPLLANAPAAVAASPQACVSDCFQKKTSTAAPSLPIPKSVRSNLAAVILRMASLNLGDVAAFPFLEMPDSRYINDGVSGVVGIGGGGGRLKIFSVNG